MARPLNIRASITGDRALDAKLKALEPKIAKKHLRQVLRARLKPIHTAAIAAMDVDTGKMRTGLKIAATKRSRKGLGIKAQIGDELRRSQNAEAQGSRSRWPFYAGLRELGPHGTHAIERTFKAHRAAARVGILLDLRKALDTEAPKPP